MRLRYAPFRLASSPAGRPDRRPASAVRAATRRGLTLLLALGAAACGPSAEDVAAAQAAAAVEPVVTAFAQDLDAGRIEQARQRGTPAFQSAATPDGIRIVVQGQTGVLGRLAAREPVRIEQIETTQTPQGLLPRAVVVSSAARFAKGEARIESRLERGAADGAWRVDKWTVHGSLFRWDLR